ncbi:hypothetical protein GCM10023205_71730 [Yinghuangia aomiensis]|uniref:non-specific serine/threonine protein kinase n=1 Tax=Yinghuangia aomiensis TaxID=676205 RepID=A0ABP9I8G3_9ACTN
MEALKPGDPGVVGRYRLSARLGDGRLGAVFLGADEDGETVAIRLVRPDLATDAKFLGRFRKATDAVRAVDGAHVARVLDADADGTPPWLAAEYAPGITLADAVRDHGPLPEEALRALGSALARALAAVHEAKVTHQGLSAATVQLTEHGPQITDLGISAMLGADASSALPAPEQATGGGVRPATDVFALAGVVCAAAGVAPYGDTTGPALAQKVLRSAPDLAGLPEDLVEIVAKCLAKRPDARPSAAELAQLFDGEDATSAAWLPKAIRAAVAEATKTAADAAAESAKKAPKPAAKPAAKKTTAKAPESDAGKDAAKPAATESASGPAKDAAKGSAEDAPKAAAKSPAKKTSPSAAEGADAKASPKAGANDTTKVAIPVPAAAAAASAAKDDADDDGDATPAATPAVPRQTRPADKDKGKDKAAESPADAGSAKPAGTLPAPGPDKATDAKADKPTDEDGTDAAKDDPAAPTVVVKSPPASDNGNGNKPGKGAKAAATPAAAPTVVVDRPLDQPQLLKPRLVSEAAAAAAPAPAAVPTPRREAPVADPTVVAPRNVAAAAPAAYPTPFPNAVPAETAAPAKREAKDAIWYAVIALVGLTSAGLAVYRLIDGDWRDLQNPVMGYVLPGIALVCGLAGILVLALAVKDRGRTPEV